MTEPDAPLPLATGAASADMPTLEQHFEAWLLHRSRADRDALTPAAAKPYRYIWLSWGRFLSSIPFDGAHGTPWHVATPQQVHRFLREGVSPASGRKSRTAPISDITRRRYWRVLDAIYQHACNNGLIPRNPVAADGADQPPPQENPQGQIFTPLHWRAIQLAFPASKSRWDARDRAILALLMDAALTTSEVCLLRLHQVGDHHTKVTLRLDGKRASQERVLQLGLGASVEMRKWMELRRGMHARAGVPEDLLFLSIHGRAMSPRLIYHLVVGTVTRAFESHGYDMPNHLGAQVLRNSRLVMWLNEGVPMDEVVRRAGFKDFRSFRGLLRHIDTKAGAHEAFGQLKAQKVSDARGAATRPGHS